MRVEVTDEYLGWINSLKDVVGRARIPMKPMVTKRISKTARTRTAAYDVAQLLRTPEEMAAYLNAWLSQAHDDVAGIARALGDIARAQGMTRVARDAGLSRESLYKALS